jgi:hypothetical protein
MSTLENPLDKGEQPVQRWRKSTHRCENNDACVETARFLNAIAVRDSAAPATDPVLALPIAHWETLIQQIKSGRHDLP